VRASSRLGSTLTLPTGGCSIEEGRLIKDMLQRVRAVNYMPDEVRATALDFTVDGVKLGKVRVEFLKRLSDYSINLRQSHTSIIDNNYRPCQASRKLCVR
jgi:hypothetical protein